MSVWPQARVAELIALRAAGWANPEIACELKTTIWSVSGKIRQLGLAAPRKFKRVCVSCGKPMPASDKNAQRCRACYNIAARAGLLPGSFSDVSEWMTLPDGVRMRRIGDIGAVP